MLIFPLKKEWYKKIKLGEKTVEYRDVKAYWEKRLFRAMLPYLIANITKIETINGKDTDLHIDKPVYAIHLTDEREAEE